jgi:hypothetical protein
VANRDSIIAHCIARGVIHEQGGIEAATEKYGARAERLGKWEALKTAARVTPKAARVAGFIVFWAVGMRESGGEEFSITEYQRFWNENERQAYRLQKEFRELWPEYETPHELALQIVKHLDDRKRSKGDVATLPAQLQVFA